jgi:cytochrome c551/c552
MRDNIYKSNLFLESVLIILIIVLLSGCSKKNDTDTGPVKNLKSGGTDKDLSEKGKNIFEQKCLICHRLDEKLVGPPLNGITKIRKPEWIMNMILKPDKMIMEDDIAKKLLEEYKAPMTNQFLSEEEAKALLEYFRMNDENK